MKLNANERRVLIILADARDDDDVFCYLDFAHIAANTQLDRRIIRRACRSLARKGYAEYCKGLWSDDGMPAGAGYSATKKGLDELRCSNTLSNG